MAKELITATIESDFGKYVLVGLGVSAVAITTVVIVKYDDIDINLKERKIHLAKTA